MTELITTETGLPLVVDLSESAPVLPDRYSGDLFERGGDGCPVAGTGCNGGSRNVRFRRCGEEIPKAA